MTERVLSTHELNRALLARQLLLQRSRLPLTQVLERVGGLQAQYAPSAYVGLWSRLRDFRGETLTKALELRRAVQTRARGARNDKALLTSGCPKGPGSGGGLYPVGEAGSSMIQSTAPWSPEAPSNA